MITIENRVKVLDAVLGCVPIVASISNAAQALYKLAHTVDAVANPVVPGWKTSIKIHVLTKDYEGCLLGAIPVMGNVFNLYKLIEYARFGFNDHPFLDIYNDALMKAVIRNNKEIVGLSLWNNALDDPERADRVFRSSR